MCTALCYRTGKSYFGRNLDLEYGYGESIMIAPRNFPFRFLHEKSMTHHYALIGAGTEMKGYPLYYDAINEYGLGMAALNFTKSCVMNDAKDGEINLATFEIIQYVLSVCKSVAEAKTLLQKINLTPDRFSYKLPAARLHFFLSDKIESITAEPREGGFSIYKNQVEILTNEPPFPKQMENLKNAESERKIHSQNTSCRICDSELYEKASTMTKNEIAFAENLSSEQRFLRAVAALRLSEKKTDNNEAVNQFFHILSNVEYIDGAITLSNVSKKTQYSSCASLDDATYYCKTYSNSRIFSVRIKKEHLTSDALISYPFIIKEDVMELDG